MAEMRNLALEQRQACLWDKLKSLRGN